jgi:hypothetical protein
MEMERSGQLLKAALPMLTSFESGSNVTTDRLGQGKNERKPSSRTDDGMQIDDSFEQFEKVVSRTCRNLELDSNVTIERLSHEEKQPAPSSSTEAGMQIDDRDAQPENALRPIEESADPDSKSTIDSLSQ